ncbi:MAG: glycogen debranching enzyme N-terminal domain-containing protein, partial [Planctomycetes bacterium]|nr:glycogen debranching enzyme N-terminal domain-containing protein [Planctomycetota bacterium]
MNLHFSPQLPFPDREWRLDDGLGGYSSGTASGIRSKREQALVAVARAGGAWVLVNGFDAWVTTPAGRFPISSQRYAPDAVHPDGAWRVESFVTEPWPTWRFRLDDATLVKQEISVIRGHSLVGVRWSVEGGAKGVSIEVRPFLSGREERSLQKENRVFRLAAEIRGWKVTWRPYDGVPEVAMYSSAKFDADPHWYHNFVYEDGATEDLASPGVFRGAIASAKPVELILAGGGWQEVVEGMILPEHPVFWNAPVVGWAGGRKG